MARATQNSHRLKLNMLPPWNKLLETFATNFGFRLAHGFRETALLGRVRQQEVFQLDSFAGAKY
jgi:hypothetical protein